MSANTIQLTLTEEAATELTSLIKDAAEGSFLRVWVAGGGCSGLSYGMALDDSKEDDDLITEDRGVTIVVDNLSAQYLGGSTIEYKDDMLGGFKVNNPNAKQSCGCSNSFSVEDKSSPCNSCNSL